MRVREALQLSSLTEAAVVAGEGGLDRQIRWAHVVDLPDPLPWVGHGQLLLSTGYAWPSEPNHQRDLIRALAAKELAAVGLAVPRYAEHFSAAAKEAAVALELPLLEIPWATPFARITEELHRALLAAQQATIERSESIHRALTQAATEGTNLQDLARRLGELIGRSIAFEDADGRSLATYEMHPPEHEAAGRVSCPIRVGPELAGIVQILEGDTPLSDLDRRAAEHAAVVAALVIAHQRELAQLESRLGYASFLSLLEAPDGAAPQALERARLLGFDPTVTYRVGIVFLDERLPLDRAALLRRDRLLESTRRALAQCGVARPLLGHLLDQLPFLLPEGVGIDELVAALDGEPVRIAFGRPYSGTDGVRVSYREARSLVAYDGAARVLCYEAVLLPRVLQGDSAARAAFLEQLLGPLNGRRGGEAMRDAVLAYAAEGFRFRRTAERLGVHPNTLRYRLERARETTGLNFDDPEVRFRLQLARRLLELGRGAEAVAKT
jgi:PucR family transcriptional regulator, purine catabolism regulatory protein